MFAQPIALLALIAAPVAAALLWYAVRKRAEAREAFGAPYPARSRGTALRGAAVALAMAALAIALAGPRLGTELQESRQESIDLIIAFDISSSMLARDTAPSRLERARFEVARFLDEYPGQRIGLVFFAADAFLQCPLTTDYGAVRLFLDIADPDLAAVQGTDFAEAFRVAREALDAPSEGTAGDTGAQAILLVTDGEDHEGGGLTAARAARRDGIHVVAAGVGTPQGGTIPADPARPQTGDRTRDGEPIVTRFDDSTLRDISGPGGFVHIDAGQRITDLIPELRRLDAQVVATGQFATHAERFQWPLALALILLALDFAWPRNRKDEIPA
ncbi:VWA domain-containing protein [soil metagenome]